MNDSDALLADVIQRLQDDEHLGILLAAQMGGTPEEIQLIVQVAAYDEPTDALRPESVFLLRCLGVREQRLSLGLFNVMASINEHPLLWNHSARYQQVYFRGEVVAADTLMLELNQLYGKHYGPFRSLADDINRALPLGRLLASGHGLLGEMPMPMAAHVKKLFERYDLEITLITTDQDAPPIDFQLLVMDDSFLIAQSFSIEPMQGRHDF